MANNVMMEENQKKISQIYNGHVRSFYPVPDFSSKAIEKDLFWDLFKKREIGGMPLSTMIEAAKILGH